MLKKVLGPQIRCDNIFMKANYGMRGRNFGKVHNADLFRCSEYWSFFYQVQNYFLLLALALCPAMSCILVATTGHI